MSRTVKESRPGSSSKTGARPTLLNHNLTTSTGIGLGISMLWFSLLVLIPLAAVIAAAAAGGWAEFWRTITNEQTASAIKLTVLSAAGVTVVNIFVGTAIAWVLVRDKFWGKGLLELII